MSDDQTPVERAHHVLGDVMALTAEVEKLRGDIRGAHAKLVVGKPAHAEKFLQEIVDEWDYPEGRDSRGEA